LLWEKPGFVDKRTLALRRLVKEVILLEVEKISRVLDTVSHAPECVIPGEADMEGEDTDEEDSAPRRKPSKRKDISVTFLSPRRKGTVRRT
jgi:hypothetical protein